MGAQYLYQLFISYSSKDREWAQKMKGDLEARGIRAFLDQRDLELGKPWDAALKEAVRDSQHLLVLWSNYANSSPWVHTEMATFDVDRKSTRLNSSHRL